MATRIKTGADCGQANWFFTQP